MNLVKHIIKYLVHESPTIEILHYIQKGQSIELRCLLLLLS
jgi:hypothetical protein